MNPLPFESKNTYYGDDWLEFHDYLDTLTDREGIFIELTFGHGLINPRELAYKSGAKTELLIRMKCLIEINREPDKTKHDDILKKYGIVVLPQAKPIPDAKDNMYG